VPHCPALLLLLPLSVFGDKQKVVDRVADLWI